jgi:L-seryl-tRNA(Ser) seleniumtransferase
MGAGDQNRRHVPSVDKLLQTKELKTALLTFPRWAVLQEARAVLDAVRSGAIPVVVDGERDEWLTQLGREAARRVAATSQYSLKRVINATGVVLHTNLGRAPLADRAIQHMVEVASRYSNLELDLGTGERGSRYAHVEDLVCELTGAEAAVVCNNNAAAVILCLSAFTQGKEVVISRGELVEIGGSFRIPEIMRMSGAILVEVGTTNRAHLVDYQNAITPQTAMLLKVHTSNFRVIGFTSSVEVPELVPLAKKHNLMIMNDLGAGCLVDMRRFGLPPEPSVQEALKDGADILTFSGDKLLGGPQMGCIIGKKELIKQVKKHQLLRALRVDKLTLAAFEATLRIYRDAKDPVEELPGLRMLGMSVTEIGARADRFAAQLEKKVPEGVVVGTAGGQSQVGAGSAPERGLETRLVTVRPKNVQVEQIEAELRRQDPPVMVRVYGGELLVDLRTIYPDEEPILMSALEKAIAWGESHVAKA